MEDRKMVEIEYIERNYRERMEEREIVKRESEER